MPQVAGKFWPGYQNFFLSQNWFQCILSRSCKFLFCQNFVVLLVDKKSTQQICYFLPVLPANLFPADISNPDQTMEHQYFLAKSKGKWVDPSIIIMPFCFSPSVTLAISTSFTFVGGMLYYFSQTRLLGYLEGSSADHSPAQVITLWIAVMQLAVSTF